MFTLAPFCRSPCGERGLKLLYAECPEDFAARRSPCGERGLKFYHDTFAKDSKLSLPVRGAWIEISRSLFARKQRCGRSPCGERGLKCTASRACGTPPLRRSPCGERGLKSSGLGAVFRRLPSLPVRGAWIEMPEQWRCKQWLTSLPVRGAWIEIMFMHQTDMMALVAPRAGSVD